MGSSPWFGGLWHISNHLLSDTHTLLTAIIVQVWLTHKPSSLDPQLRPQLLTSLHDWVAGESFLYGLLVSSGANIVSICRAWSQLCLSFKNLLCAVKFSTRVVRRSPPSKRRGGCTPWTNLPDTWWGFCQASPRSQLPPWSQPAVSPVWQMTLTSADTRTFYWLTHMAAVEGRGWRVEVQVWRMRGFFSDHILYSTNLRQAWTDKLSWWHHCARPLQKHVCTGIFSP